MYYWTFLWVCFQKRYELTVLKKIVNALTSVEDQYLIHWGSEKNKKAKKGKVLLVLELKHLFLLWGHRFPTCFLWNQTETYNISHMLSGLWTLVALCSWFSCPLAGRGQIMRLIGLYSYPNYLYYTSTIFNINYIRYLPMHSIGSISLGNINIERFNILGKTQWTPKWNSGHGERLRWQIQNRAVVLFPYIYEVAFFVIVLFFPVHIGLYPRYIFCDRLGGS